MKKILFFLLLCVVTSVANSQNASVENSTFGLQVGFLGAWVNNETKLSSQIALRSEIGFDSKVWGGYFYGKTGILLTPVITLEPRWYYNLNKRERKNKKIAGNSGNFIALKTSYRPDWFVISNYDVSVVSDISIVPTWGLRRNIGDHFTFETGFGLGYMYYFAKAAGYLENKGELAVNLHLRVGYRF